MLQEIAEKYRAAGESWPATTHMMAGWAIRAMLWKPHPGSLVRQCAKEIAGALRDEYFTDPQGRRVRKKHCYREEQFLLWVDIEDAQPQEMQGAFQYRRLLVLGDCRQLKVDVDSYNENNQHGAHIQMCFDFTKDLAELAQPTQYAGIA
jgi:hypothetical protein